MQTKSRIFELEKDILVSIKRFTEDTGLIVRNIELMDSGASRSAKITIDYK